MGYPIMAINPDRLSLSETVLDGSLTVASCNGGAQRLSEWLEIICRVCCIWELDCESYN